MGKSWSLDGGRAGMESPGAGDEVEEKKPLKIAIIGDFSGRGSQRNAKPRGSGAIRALAIDRDNFEQVLQHLNVRLDDVPVQPSGALGSVAIDSLDDFHPDSLLQRVASFRALRELRGRLAKRESFAEALQEARGVLQPPSVEQQPAPPPTAATNPPADGASLLDQVLAASETDAEPPPRRLNDIERYAQALMAPYSIPADDPRQEPWLEAADKAAAFAVRQLLQAPKFRELEARWRSLDWLLRRVDSDVAVKVAVIDLSEAELRADLDRENLAESALYELLVARPKVRPGEAGWQALVLDLQFGSRIADIELLGRWSQIATDANAKLLVGLRDEAVGCVAAQPFTPAEFSEASAAWNSLQQLPDTAKACAVWPGFILRQPYGKQSSEVESLELEELANVEHPQGVLLFGSGAYLAAAILIRGQEDDSSNDFTGLPCVVLKDSAGQKQMVPASGWWLREGALEHLNALGVTVAYALPQAGALRMFPLRNLQGNLL